MEQYGKLHPYVVTILVAALSMVLIRVTPFDIKKDS